MGGGLTSTFSFNPVDHLLSVCWKCDSLKATSEAAEEEAYHKLQLCNGLASWLDFHIKSGKHQRFVQWEPVIYSEHYVCRDRHKFCFEQNFRKKYFSYFSLKSCNGKEEADSYLCCYTDIIQQGLE